MKVWSCGVRLKALYVITVSDTKQSLLNHVIVNAASPVIIGLLYPLSIILTKNPCLKEKLKSILQNITK